MQAWLLEKLGSLENMHLGEVAEPMPGPRDVVMEMAFAALNPADRYLALGQYPARPELPHILGRDGVGRIVSVGTDVKNWEPGDQALILRGPVG
ncbi:MAG: zinc-binding alcohol dehydrogenase family protein, partial [Phycisphaerae bacterium]|nr:zinc-binding alcohol dehydrogenase family protein [Phycisphaerae bacterium]